MNKERLFLGIATGTLLALCAWETSAALLRQRRAPEDADWSAVSQEVRAGFRAGDLIAFAPAWADPIGRHWLGDLLTLDMVSRNDADRYARIWEITERGAHVEDAVGHALSTHAHGRLTVTLWDHPSTPPPYDFTQHTDDARVTSIESRDAIDREHPGAEHPCLHDIGTGFRCPGSRVERRTLEIDYRPRRGILVPLEPARVTRLEWSEIPIGRQFIGYVGIHDYYARKRADGLVNVQISIDGRAVKSLLVTNSDGWKRFDIDAVGLALGGIAHVVRVDVSAPDVAWRNLGIHLESRP